MNAFWTVFEIGVNCFQGWMFTWFIYRMLTIRPERTRKQIAVSSALTGFLFAAGLTVYLYVDIPVTDSVLFVLLFMYALYLFEGEWYVKLAWTIIDCVMMVMSTTLFTVLFISITGVTRDILTASTGIRIAFVIMANAFMFSVYYAISKVRWRQDRLSLPPLLLFLGLAISLLICQEMQYSMLPQEGVPQKSVSISIIFISVISGGILVLFAMLSSQAEKRAEMEIQANAAALTRKHYSEIKGMYQGMLQQQHDMKHQINALEEMIAEGNLAESTNYLSQLRQTALPLRYATGCVSVDALLSAKTAAMRQDGIDFEYTAYPLNELPIEETLFCALVGNLLENAIEGVQRIHDPAIPKQVHLRFARSRDVFFISCRNTVAPDTVRQRGEAFLSSKRRGQQGLGIPSIRSTVQSAGGNCSFGMDGEWFTAEIELPYN